MITLARQLPASLTTPAAARAATATGFAAAALTLMVEPARWLAESWVEPAYDSSGLLVFALAAGLFLWSVTSPRASGFRGPRDREPGRADPDAADNAPASRHAVALGLLAAAALARLAGQVLAVNVIGAACLVLDVWAAGLLARLDERARPVSPGWLAVVFAFSLPVERILQRGLGHLLQELSAEGACGLLSLVFPDIVCEGVRLVLDGADVLVDLPCSGARGLLLGLLGFAVAACLCQPGLAQAVLGAALTLAAGALSNVLRVSALAVGIAEPGRFGGIDVMAQPWHDLIGLAALSLTGLAVAVWAVRCPQRPVPAPRPARRRRTPVPGPAGAALALGLALAVVNLPRTPVDVARAAAPVTLPLALNGHPVQPVPLTPREQSYFLRYGGSAAKAEYGGMGLLVTRTTSPLRHLHAPEDCLRGLGFEVTYLGAAFAPLPTAIYRAVSPEGRVYRVEVSFVPDRGPATYNVAAAVWRWMAGEAAAWTAIQRISPEGASARDRARFTAAVLAAFDLAPSPEG